MALFPAVWFSYTISELILNTSKQSPGREKPLQRKITNKDCYSLVREITVCWCIQDSDIIAIHIFKAEWRTL